MSFLHRRFRIARRRWLARAAALASAAAAPSWVPRVWANVTRADKPSPVNTLPRFALVMGNSKYPQEPLRNPGNDARAIASSLKELGFAVSLQVDCGRARMADAIQSFEAELAKSKGVGLFYYAGHGVQLAWRNYLVPVDAEIDKLEEVQQKAIELNALLQGLVRAHNPMNVIILDACRDNPFGQRVPTEVKGLSQFDAPPGSLLAYATAPGRTASDGPGENGLYTEHLLRELKVPDAKIEDVFKRVRLAVRRRSQGQQIPWESTSLEEDFYFVPPKAPNKVSPEELERQFEEELALWERIKTSTEPAPFEEYLRTRPSGRFAELAQFRLDRLLAQRETAAQLAAAGKVLQPASGPGADFKYVGPAARAN